MTAKDAFGARTTLGGSARALAYFRLQALEDEGLAELDLIPRTVKVFLENLVRLSGTEHATEDDVTFLAMWGQKPLEDKEFAFSPARVLLQDFTGVPTVVDLAAMRQAM